MLVDSGSPPPFSIVASWGCLHLVVVGNGCFVAFFTFPFLAGFAPLVLFLDLRGARLLVAVPACAVVLV